MFGRKYIFFHYSTICIVSSLGFCLLFTVSQLHRDASFLGVKANVRRIFSISVSSFSAFSLCQKDEFQNDPDTHINDLCVLHFCPPHWHTQTSFSVWIERVRLTNQIHSHWFGDKIVAKTNPLKIRTYKCMCKT